MVLTCPATLHVSVVCTFCNPFLPATSNIILSPFISLLCSKRRPFPGYPPPQAWSPNLEAALYNRYVRLLIHCSNQVNHEDGYLIFKVGDQAFDESCEDHSGLCVDDGPDDDTDSGVRCEAGVGVAYVLAFVVGLLSLFLVLD